VVLVLGGVEEVVEAVQVEVVRVEVYNRHKCDVTTSRSCTYVWD